MLSHVFATFSLCPGPMTQTRTISPQILVVIWTRGETATEITTSICGDFDLWCKTPQKTPHRVKITTRPFISVIAGLVLRIIPLLQS